MNPSESLIERRVCDYARSKGCLAYKFTSPARRGVPDRIIIAPSGEVVFVEFKSRKGVLTPLQEIEIEKLRKRHQKVKVINSIFLGMMLVDEITKPLI